MDYASSISTRENGSKILSSWFNQIKTVLTSIEAFFGTSGYISETSFTLANGQASAANVTGLSFNKDNHKGAQVWAQVTRKTGTNESVSIGRLLLYYKTNSAAWYLEDELMGDDDGVVFSITSAGQVQYTSDTMAGSGYSGTIKFRAMSFNA